MDGSFDLERYLNEGVRRLFRDAVRLTLKHPEQSAFFMKMAAASKTAAAKRHEFERQKEHIPSFLIASITQNCNLRCSGCYSHANRTCGEVSQLPVEMWERVFREAEDLGISVILLAGGEPLLRRDVLAAAAKSKGLLFPVLTNGTLLDEAALDLFSDNRNLVPVISIEGGEGATDFRRGQGVYALITESMRRLRERNLLFGVSVTVTSENIDAVTDEAFIEELERDGCKVVLFVEYVPVQNEALALSEEERISLAVRVSELRSRKNSIIVVSFPGDEAESGGCLAAGRGFFHISAAGNAEPCPFSPYSDLNLSQASLREALKSPLFTRLREEGALSLRHTGGCTLYEQRETVARMAGAEL